MALKNKKEPKEPKAPKAPKTKTKPEKAPKAPKERGKFGNPFSKKEKINPEDEGLDILTDIKDPFSFSNFFDQHVVEPFKRAKAIMADKGILFFLFSPFQARGRLIAELLILCVGVGFGVVPRAMTLVSALQDQAYASEIAGLSEKTIGRMTITPAASSHYKGVHMIAFILDGKTAEDTYLPSDPSKYEVHLARGYGASDWTDVTYSWTIYPTIDSRRILLLSIDQTKQASGYGAFDLYIQLEGEEVKDYQIDQGVFEITLSRAQETRELYDKNGIHLSAVTEALLGKGEIAKKQADFTSALAKYQVALEQAEAMPIDLTVTPTTEKLETYCLANRVYREINDDSNTEDILGIDKISDLPILTYDVVLTSDGIPYDKEWVEKMRPGTSGEDKLIIEAFDNVETAKQAVLAAMGNVNIEAKDWFDKLTDWRLILNQTIKEKGFPLCARVVNLITDPIEFIEAEAMEPDGDDGGLTGTMTGDDPIVTPPPVVDEPVVTDPPVEQEPVEEEPETVEPVEDDPEEDPEPVEPVETPKKTETDKNKGNGYTSPVTGQYSGNPADNK